MTFIDCIRLKDKFKVSEYWDNGLRHVLLVTPETHDYFHSYLLDLHKERQDHHAISFSIDEKFILRWIGEDGSFRPLSADEMS